MKALPKAIWLLGLFAVSIEPALADPAVMVCLGDDPAAEVVSFKVVDSVAQWLVSAEYGTVGYLLEGSQTSAGPWTQIGPMEAPGNTSYRVDVLGSGFEFFRLVEVDIGGTRRVVGVESSLPPAPVQESRLSREELVAKLDSLEHWRQTSGMTGVESAGIPYVIYTPAIFQQDVQNYVAAYWATYGGYLPVIVTTDNFPQPPDHDGFRQALKASIVGFASSGAKYFHLIGDWTDWREYTDPAVYPALWVGEWERIREVYLQNRPIQPELDLIPTYVIPDTAPPDQSMTGLTRPYWFSDQEYADTNGDSIPDVVLTRWPIGDDNDLLSLAYKMQLYNSWAAFAAPYDVSLYVNDTEKVADSGDGARAAGVADAVMAALSGQRTYRVNKTNYSTDSSWLSAVQGSWTSVFPEAVVLVASQWHAYSLKDIVIRSLPSTAMPFVVGATCSAADFAGTELHILVSGQEVYGRPTFHRLLTAPSQGAIAWVGPTAGTWQEGNQLAWISTDRNSPNRAPVFIR